MALDYARRAEVLRMWDKTEVVVTARDIIAEAYTFIPGKTKNDALARLWLDAANSSRVRIVDPPYEAVAEYIKTHPGSGPLNWPDMALALVAEQAGTQAIATEDAAFQRLGFMTPFARTQER